MTDPRFLQPGVDAQIAHVVEEAGEFLAAVGKSYRWGLLSENPLLPSEQREPNVTWLWRELLDLQQVGARLLATLEATYPNAAPAQRGETERG